MRVTADGSFARADRFRDPARGGCAAVHRDCGKRIGHFGQRERDHGDPRTCSAVREDAAHGPRTVCGPDAARQGHAQAARDRAGALFVILEGRCKAYVSDEDGREAVLGLVTMKEALEDPARLLFDI